MRLRRLAVGFAIALGILAAVEAARRWLPAAIGAGWPASPDAAASDRSGPAAIRAEARPTPGGATRTAGIPRGAEGGTAEPSPSTAPAANEQGGAGTADAVAAAPSGPDEAPAVDDVAETDLSLPAGAVRGDGSRDCPLGHPIKGNASSMIYHPPGAAAYAATIPEFCFASPDFAEAGGFRAARR